MSTVTESTAKICPKCSGPCNSYNGRCYRCKPSLGNPWGRRGKPSPDAAPASIAIDPCRPVGDLNQPADLLDAQLHAIHAIRNALAALPRPSAAAVLACLLREYDGPASA